MNSRRRQVTTTRRQKAAEAAYTAATPAHPPAEGPRRTTPHHTAPCRAAEGAETGPAGTRPQPPQNTGWAGCGSASRSALNVRSDVACVAAFLSSVKRNG